MSNETIYDHPLYYDILFGWDRSHEADVYQDVFRRCGVGPDEPILEVACGTGQIALRLARRGWHVTGLDIDPKMLAFLRDRAAAEGVAVATRCADMTAFASEAVFGAAYSPMSSFRLLHTDAEAEAHLRTLAAALRPEGVYVLDLEIQERASTPSVTNTESWSMTRANVTVHASEDAVRVDDAGVFRALRRGRDVHLRPTTAAAFTERVAASGAFHIEGWLPESGRDAEGVSRFDPSVPQPVPRAGRALVVLRRR